MASFYGEIRKYWRGLADGQLRPDYAGVRPKIYEPNEPQADFDIAGPGAHGIHGLACLFGIESPGLTACLAIGACVEELLRDAAPG
jgi:L-2-hydroxyglutarate oxidase LhgO